MSHVIGSILGDPKLENGEFLLGLPTLGWCHRVDHGMRQNKCLTLLCNQVGGTRAGGGEEGGRGWRSRGSEGRKYESRALGGEGVNDVCESQ